MTALDLLRDAIAKLEAIKAATPGTWEVDTNAPFSSELVGIFVPEASGYAVKFDHEELPSSEVAEALVTLHRTLDAQIGILSDAIRHFSGSSIWSEPNTTREVALATSILGCSS